MTKTKERKKYVPKSNRYDFKEAIGEGGMGTVYRAFDRHRQEPVAIKVLSEKLSENPTLHQRLLREFKAAQGLEHPNIVRALAFEHDGDMSYVVFELVEGGSVGDLIETNGRLHETDALRIITQAAQALHYAHQKQVVHRDVKPDNLLVLADGRVKLTDFGLAKDYSRIDDECLTRAASGLGTPHFMAPEQFADARNAGPLCDVYSLAATLYCLLTAKLPFDAKFPLAILTKKETGKLDPVRKYAPQTSEAVELAIRAGVDPDPAKRPKSCLEFFKRVNTKRRPREDVVNTPMPPLSRKMPAENRRACVRYPVLLGTVGIVDSGDTEEFWPLHVQDLSAGGVKLLLARRFEPGSELAIELNQTGQAARRLPVKVVRVSRDRAGHWAHGCAFPTPLADPDLKRLLKAT